MNIARCAIVFSGVVFALREESLILVLRRPVGPKIVDQYVRCNQPLIAARRSTHFNAASDVEPEVAITIYNPRPRSVGVGIILGAISSSGIEACRKRCYARWHRHRLINRRDIDPELLNNLRVFQIKPPIPPRQLHNQPGISFAAGCREWAIVNRYFQGAAVEKKRALRDLDAFVPE